MGGVRQHEIAAALAITRSCAREIAARLDRRDDAFRAAGREVTGCRWRSVEYRKPYLDHFVFHSLQPMEGAFATQRILVEELHKGIAPDGRRLLVATKDVQRNTAAAPIGVASAQCAHSREYVFARETC